MTKEEALPVIKVKQQRKQRTTTKDSHKVTMLATFRKFDVLCMMLLVGVNVSCMRSCLQWIMHQNQVDPIFWNRCLSTAYS